MTSSRSQDVSLYELALSAEQPPHPLQVSPTTFKSMVATVLDVLIDQKISATLWAKFPKGAAWQTELDRFRKLATAPFHLYNLNSYREETGDAPENALFETESSSLPSILNDGELVDDQSIISNSTNNGSRHLGITLAPDSMLRREYFLLVYAPELCILTLAHRPRTVRSGKSQDLAQTEAIAAAKAGASGEEELERKHPLLGLYSFDLPTLQEILGGIRRAIVQSHAQFTSELAVANLLSQWDSVTAPLLTASFNPCMIGHLLTRQVQQQEDVWHSSANFRKQAEKATTLQMENEELINSVRLKDEFLKNVGQELRTPLATMKTALTLLNSPTLKPAQRQRYMDMLTQECDRQSALITSVLDLLQLETTVDPVPAQPVRLSDVVPGVVSTYQPLAQEKGVMLAYTIPEELPTVSCSIPWLRQIVINLLHNGIKFTPQGGQVWVRAKQQGDYVQLEVRDTGVGIPATELPKIFDRFYRVRSGITGEDNSGAGLGLSIVQQLLLRCGGSISVKSKQSEGSTFTVLLPTYHT